MRMRVCRVHCRGRSWPQSGPALYRHPSGLRNSESQPISRNDVKVAACIIKRSIRHCVKCAVAPDHVTTTTFNRCEQDVRRRRGGTGARGIVGRGRIARDVVATVALLPCLTTATASSIMMSSDTVAASFSSAWITLHKLTMAAKKNMCSVKCTGRPIKVSYCRMIN